MGHTIRFNPALTDLNINSSDVPEVEKRLKKNKRKTKKLIKIKRDEENKKYIKGRLITKEKTL